MKPLDGNARDYDPLLDRIGDARLVFLGEASHGTQEFYRERSVITRRLIEEKGFLAIAVEADWPDAERVNRYVRGLGDDRDPIQSLADFRRFPSWMWRNAEIVELVGWLRAHNDALPPGAPKVGFYGLDLYSPRSSMKAVLRFLDRVDPPAAQRARQRYARFARFSDNTQAYGRIAGSDGKSCEEEVLAQLVELERRWLDGVMPEDPDALFHAAQNARLVKSAEAYYRTMYQKDVSSWNLRDRHMAEMLEALIIHLDRERPSKIAVWAHNSHLGDARATELGRRGELNLGQLTREKRPAEVVLVGFTTHHGTVTAAPRWDGPVEKKQVRPALPGSFEALFHAVRPSRFLMIWRNRRGSPRLPPRLERAIGAIYRPDTERTSHYFEADLEAQFDAVIHIDETRAVEPLDARERWAAGELPDTVPIAV
jgi:erythromycin esterase-like protein